MSAARAVIACHIRAHVIARKLVVIQSSHTVFHHRTYIRIYPHEITSYSRNNHVILKMWLYPHVMLCINKNNYEHTRKKARHFHIRLCCYYDYSIHIWCNIMSTTVIIITVWVIIAVGYTLYVDNKDN